MKARFTLFGIGVAILTLLSSLSSLALEPALTPSYPSAPDPWQTLRSPHPGELPSPPESSTSVDADDWTIILADGFEGDFPGDWTFSGHPDFTFWKRDCRASERTHSAWCIGKSTSGPDLRCGSLFPTTQYNHPSNMTYGPFSLEDAWAAELSFSYWLDMAYPDGGGSVAASMGRHSSRLGLLKTYPDASEGCTDGWCTITVDLAAFPYLGNLCGQPEVWIEFSSYTFSGNGQGLFVDDVVVRAKFGERPTATPTPTATAGPTATGAPTSTPTATRQPPTNPVYLPLIRNAGTVEGTPTVTMTPLMPTPTATFTPPPPPPTPTETPSDGPGWHNVVEEDFEGEWPGEWDLLDRSSYDGGEYLWGKRDCDAYESTYSAWCVGGGADGSQLPCGVDYPNFARSWMIYGPFALPEAEHAYLTFRHRPDIEPNVDTLFIGFSLDGETFSGGSAAIHTFDWFLIGMDLKGGGEDVTGQEEVWIGFEFRSDRTITYPGAFIDDVVVTWCASGCSESAIESMSGADGKWHLIEPKFKVKVLRAID